MDNEPTASEASRNEGKRKRQESEPAEHLPQKSRAKREPSGSSTSRSSPAEDRAVVQREQNEYVPQNHRIYSPLDRALHDVRILVLKAGQLHMPLKCFLLQLPLAKAEETGFETVSYCWGDPNDQAVIDVEGLPLRVPVSAKDALQHFRCPDKDRLLWMDSICLNQADLEERSHEVARMHLIYSRGRGNLIWLGLDDGDAVAAVNAMHTIFDEVLLTPDIREAFIALIKNPSCKPPNFPDHVVRCEEVAVPFLELFTRPWFRRLWIVQEAVLSKESEVYCGNAHMDFHFMMRTYYWLLNNESHINSAICSSLLRRTPMAESMELFLIVDPDCGWKALANSPGEEPFLWLALAQFQKLNASNP